MVCKPAIWPKDARIGRALSLAFKFLAFMDALAVGCFRPEDLAILFLLVPVLLAFSTLRGLADLAAFFLLFCAVEGVCLAF